MFRFKCQCLFRVSHVFFVVMASLMLNLLSGSVAFAQAGDEFEGAVWRFSMTPNGQGDLSMDTGTGGTLSAPGLRNRLPSVAKPGSTCDKHRAGYYCLISRNALASGSVKTVS